MTGLLNPRAQSMLSVALPAILVGIAAALMLFVVMLVAGLLQHFLWSVLPPLFGATNTTWWWIVGMLTLTGIVVGLVVKYVPGHAGDDPATLELFGPPTPLPVLPGLALALVIALAGGVSLGPENPILAIAIGVTVAVGTKLLPGVKPSGWVALAAAGMIGAMFGTPVAAALLFSEMLTGTKDEPIWDQLFGPLLAAGAGTVTMLFLEQPSFALAIAPYSNPQLIDLVTGALVVLAAVGAGMLAVWAFPRVHQLFWSLKHPVLMMGLGGLLLGILGVIGGPITMFKGLAEMNQLVATSGNYAVGGFLLLVVIKLVAVVISATCGFRGGRIFPMVFVGVAFGFFVNALLPFIPLPVALAASVLGFMLVVTRDGWLSLFMAVVMVPGHPVLPVLCVIILVGWVALAGQPLMLIETEAPPAPAKAPKPRARSGATR